LGSTRKFNDKFMLVMDSIRKVETHQQEDLNDNINKKIFEKMNDNIIMKSFEN